MLNIDDRLIKEVSPKIKPNALSVLLAIAIHLNQRTNRCFPSHARLMQLTGMGKNAVYDALAVLRENNLLVSEQPIDVQSRKFGRRVFRLTTRFVKIFIDAEDANPLPESREPDFREPDFREPYQINNREQINKEEQATTAAEKNPIPLEAEKNTPPPPISPPPPAPLALSGFVDPAAEVERLRTDELALETFVRNRRIPQELYERYLQEFATEVTATQEPHYGVAAFRRHFFNWAEKHYRIAKERAAQPAPGRSSIPAGIKTFGA